MKVLLEYSVNTEKLKSRQRLTPLDVKDIPDSIVESLLYEDSDHIFNVGNGKFEKMIGEITKIKID